MIVKNEYFLKGKALGQSAFHSGYSCNPEHDNALKDMYVGKDYEIERSFKNGWLSGWRGELLNTGEW